MHAIQTMARTTSMAECSSNTVAIVLWMSITFALMLHSVNAQPSISSVSPDQAQPGDSNVNVVATLVGSPLPPDEVDPTGYSIGSIDGTNVVRNGSQVSADFSFPGDYPDGDYTVTITFPTPGDDLVLTLTNGFTVGNGGGGVIVGPEVPVGLTYPIVDTGQTLCYNAAGTVIAAPGQGGATYGQDAQYIGYQMDYTLSADGLTVYDNVTGLTWTQSPDLDGDGDIDVDDKLTFAESLTYADSVLNPASFGGYSDWRLPSMKELYSLMNFSGTDPSGGVGTESIPFIDTDFFDFGYGDEAAGEREIDAQFWTTAAYLGQVFDNQDATFGLNLADGRIKGYPTSGMNPKVNYVYFVRGNTSYGINDFVDNGDQTITDRATGLMWMKDDCGPQTNPGAPAPGSGMDWETALAWVEQKNAENYLGHDDWRMPNAKELHSLFDYDRAPDATASAAIDPIFNITQIVNEEGAVDYPWFWTSTTHVRSDGTGPDAAYLCFGRATGYMSGEWMDVHGAGAQRSDPKDGDFTGLDYVSDGYYSGVAPQGDATRLYNYVRLVRDTGSASQSAVAASGWMLYR